MKPVKRIVIVAGEESGDMHAAHMVRQLLANNPNLQITGIGGQHMQDAGVELISDLARFGVTGLSEVIRHFRVIRAAFHAIKAHLIANKPDLLILVDYPGFNLRLAAFAKKKLGIRVLYYISPQIWAWKANRIHTIRASVDRMAVILPFEKKIYAQAGVAASFVGHPLVETIKDCTDVPALRQSLNLPHNKRIIALLPGSRMHEIERHMPVMRDCALQLTQQLTDLHFVIPIAGTIDTAAVNAYLTDTTLPYTLIEGRAVDAVSCSECVIVASGTASLECALLKKPMCIIYKASLLTYLAASQVIKVKFLGLCNLLQNAMIVPELLQYDCNADALTEVMLSLLTDPETSKRMIARLQQLVISLSASQADSTITALIEEELQTTCPAAHPDDQAH